MVAAGNSNHLRRKVQAVSGGAARRGGSREIAWPTRDIEHMLTGRNFSGFQQRPNVGRCRMSKAVYVARSSALPAGMLKGTDGFGLKAHRSAYGSKIRRRRQLSKSVGGRRDSVFPEYFFAASAGMAIDRDVTESAVGPFRKCRNVQLES